MTCDYCGKPLAEGEEVVLEQYGAIVRGTFQPSEESSVHHADGCGDED